MLYFLCVYLIAKTVIDSLQYSFVVVVKYYFSEKVILIFIFSTNITDRVTITDMESESSGQSSNPMGRF